MRLKNICLSLLAAPIALSYTNTSLAAESAYTKLDIQKDCVFIEEYEQGGTARCSGYKGYPVIFSEGDLRQMVQFGHIQTTGGQWESFGQFNRINDTIEWRLKDKVPYAAILRWFIENSNSDGEFSKELEGQVLVVTKVGTYAKPGSCVVGYVDARANKNANTLARNIADEMSHTFECKTDSPEFHGKRGKYSGDPSRSFE